MVAAMEASTASTAADPTASSHAAAVETAAGAVATAAADRCGVAAHAPTVALSGLVAAHAAVALNWWARAVCRTSVGLGWLAIGAHARVVASDRGIVSACRSAVGLSGLP